MYKRIILMILVIGFLSCNPASAVIVNGNFETRDTTGWTIISEGNSNMATGAPFTSWFYHVRASAADYAEIRQYFDTDGYQTLSMEIYSYTGSAATVQVVMDGSSIYNENHRYLSDGVYEFDVSGYTSGYISVNTWSSTYGIKIDNLALDTPPNIIWSTWPADSWAVGNYSMITVGLPRPPDPVDFYIKTPSTDYIKKPLTKSPLVKTWNYEESRWYYQYFHTVYHAQHGNYSCKIVNSSAGFIEYSNITVPYSSPDVPIPPVVSIPIPDPIEAPPVWDVTIPEPYENVSWIFNYTDFWDDVGITLNSTLYSTVGLIFIPMESINETVYTVYTHVNTAADMVSGSEHTHIIVQVAWNVIPDSIKTIFIGAAAIGLCIFILHRRT